MATITLTAWACEFSTTASGFRCTTIEIGGPPLLTRKVQIRTAQDVVREMDAICEEAGALHPGSLQVSQRLTEGRAPSGYRQLSHKAEIDRDTVPTTTLAA
jgi:hypothetical protein